MIGTELLEGQGLGNQLFCYISARCIAKDNGYDFGILGSGTMANNIHSSCGLYFMDLDYGVSVSREDFKSEYREKEDRLTRKPRGGFCVHIPRRECQAFFISGRCSPGNARPDI